MRITSLTVTIGGEEQRERGLRLVAKSLEKTWKSIAVSYVYLLQVVRFLLGEIGTTSMKDQFQHIAWRRSDGNPHKWGNVEAHAEAKTVSLVAKKGRSVTFQWSNDARNPTKRESEQHWLDVTYNFGDEGSVRSAVKVLRALGAEFQPLPADSPLIQEAEEKEGRYYHIGTPDEPLFTMKPGNELEVKFIWKDYIRTE